MTTIIFCPKCGMENSNDEKICKHCQQNLKLALENHEAMESTKKGKIIEFIPSKAGIITTATIIGGISGLIGMFLKWNIGPYNLGFPLFVGISIFLAPTGSSLLSIILSNYLFNRNVIKKYIFSACAILNFLIWYLMFAYYFAQ